MDRDEVIDGVRQARIDLAAAYRLADRFEFNEGIDNHFSLAVPGEENQFLLIPYGLHWSEVSASNLIVVDHKGEKVSGDGFVEPTAFFIHGAIHKARDEAKCVMHTHMPYALALCMVENGRFEMADQNACRFYDRIAYDDEFGGGVFDWQEAERIAEAFGDKDILFMANHGITVVGESVAQAWEKLYYLERACKAQILARSTGLPLKIIPEETVRLVSEQIRNEGSGAAASFQRHFDALKRILDKESPGYRE